MSEHFVLEMRNITKIYPNGFVANKAVDFAVRRGEIHALVGENGAGKSTLMKVLFGVESHEEGTILLEGREIKITDPIRAIEYGIGMVHQHFMLVPSLSVAENIVLGREPKKLGVVDRERAVQDTLALCDKYNLHVDPNAKVQDLSVGLKQKVEILKALYRNAQILILDEPTAVLTPQETQELFTELRRMRASGHTIIFISHKLDEIKALCDQVTIMRLGKTIASTAVADVTEREISKMMVGRDIVLKIEKEPAKPTRPVLQVRQLRYRQADGLPVLNDVSFDVRAGEILGVAGVEGNGQKELSEIITGLLPLTQGDVCIDDQSIRGKGVKDIRMLGTSHIPEDRMMHGVVALSSVKENLIADRYELPMYSRHGFLRNKNITQLADTLVEEYRIKCDDASQPVRMLSGGNMQKVVAAREFSLSPKLSVINQPTRGIDVGATEFVRNKIVELRDRGTAVLLISADLNEILELSDALIVLYKGEIAAYIPDAKSITETELGEFMLGIQKQSADEIGGVIHDRKEN